MASIGHIAIGMAAARRLQGDADTRATIARAMVFWSLLSLLPDTDVIGFRLGVRYADEWGHRGATHSLVFALVVGVAIGLVAGRLRAERKRVAFWAVVVLASHPLLDTLTTGGLGCALFWPFDLTRYFAPWRPIPVAPIGSAFISGRGLFVVAVEAVLFLPLFIYAFLPKRPPVD